MNNPNTPTEGVDEPLQALIEARQSLTAAKASVDRAIESSLPAISSGRLDQGVEFQLRDAETGIEFALGVFEHDPICSLLPKQD